MNNRAKIAFFVFMLYYFIILKNPCDVVLFKSKKATDSHAIEEREKLQFLFNSLTKLRAGLEPITQRITSNQTALLDILTPEQLDVIL